MPSIPHSPSIGASLVSAADVKSAGGSTANLSAARAFRSSPIGSGSLTDGNFAGGSNPLGTARAFVSAPASTAPVIAGLDGNIISYR